MSNQDTQDYLKILSLCGKDYKSAFELLFKKDKTFINKTFDLVSKKFSIDMNKLKSQKDFNSAIKKIESVLNLENIPEDKIEFFINFELDFYEEDNNQIKSFEILKKIMDKKIKNKNIEKLEIKYFLILNEIIKEKLKENKFEESLQQIEEEKNKNYSNLTKSLIYKINSEIFRFQNKIDDSINEANKSLKFFEDSTEENNKLKDEKEKLTKIIINNYIQCSSLKYEKFINEEKFNESEEIFKKNVEKLKEFKNDWINECSKILSNKKQYLKAYEKLKLIDDDKFNNNKIEVLINYLNEILLKNEFDKKNFDFIEIMLNIKTKDDSIKNKIGNIYSLLIEKINKKEQKNYFDENIKKLEQKINIEKDEELKNQFDFIKQILQKKKINYELLNKNNENENNYSSLIKDILNEKFKDENEKENKSNFILNELKNKIKKSSSISSDENKFIEKEIKNENKNIKKKALEISIDLLKKGKINISNDSIKNLIENINNNKKENFIDEIIINDYSSQLIKENFNKKEKIELNEELKIKLEEGLKNEDKSNRNK